MANLNEILAEVQNLAEVYSAKIWENRRIYVNFVGFDRAFAGDRNAKCFYDLKLGWKIEGLKGCMSSAFSKSISAFAAAHNISGF